MKAQKLILSFFFVLFGLGLSSLQAQSSTSPDTVCSGSTGVNYSVTNTPGSTYYWVVNGGTQASGGNTNSITVNWNASSGTDTLKVVEMNSSGCYGDTVKLAVYRMPVPTATISGADTICYNNVSSFKVTFTGDGPWDFTYSDGTNNVDVNNVTLNPYIVATPNLTATTTYTVTKVKNHKFGCNGTTSGSAKITVNPKPVTSAIFH
jgi:hypothetical protein